MLVDPKPLWLTGTNPGLQDDVHDQPLLVRDIDADPRAFGIVPAMSHCNGLTLRLQVARELSKSLLWLTLKQLTSLLVLRDDMIFPALLALRRIDRLLVLLADDIRDIFLPSIRIGQQSLFSLVVSESDRRIAIRGHQDMDGKGPSLLLFPSSSNLVCIVCQEGKFFSSHQEVEIWRGSGGKSWLSSLWWRSSSLASSDFAAE